jgi:HSP20 family molecular chaperone IbpA
MEFRASVTPPGFGLRREIDRILGDPFTRKARDRRRSSPAPSMKMRETDREVTVMVELSDANFAGIDIDVHDGVLTVCERTQPPAEAHDPAHGGAERRDSSFQQSVRLPKDADEQGIVAHLDGSVLTVRIPKVRAAPASRHAALTQPVPCPAMAASAAMSD